MRESANLCFTYKTITTSKIKWRSRTEQGESDVWRYFYDYKFLSYERTGEPKSVFCCFSHIIFNQIRAFYETSKFSYEISLVWWENWLKSFNFLGFFSRLCCCVEERESSIYCEVFSKLNLVNEETWSRYQWLSLPPIYNKTNTLFWII